MNQIMIAFKGAKLILTSYSLIMYDCTYYNAGEIIHETSFRIFSLTLSSAKKQIITLVATRDDISNRAAEWIKTMTFNDNTIRESEKK